MSIIKTQQPNSKKLATAKKDASTSPKTKSPKVVTNISPEALQTAFFSQKDVKQSLHITEGKTLYLEVKTLAQKSFSKSMELASVIAKAKSYWNSEGKERAKAFGMKADKHTLPTIFGMSYQWFDKLAIAGNVPSDIEASYVAYCEKGRVNASIEGLNEYYKKSVGKGQHDTDGEGDGDGDGDGKKVQTIFTLSYKTDNGNVSVRVDNLGKVTTSNTKEDIKNALIFLSTHIVSLEK